MIASLVDRMVRSQPWLEPLGGFIQKVVGAIYQPLGTPGQKLKSFLQDVQYTKLAGSFQAAAAGEAMEGIGEGAAKGGGAGGAAVIGAGLNMGAGIVASSGSVQVKCLSCGTMNATTSRFCTNCGRALTGTEQTAGTP